MAVARRLIVVVCGMFQGFFSYGIIRRVNLFSDQSPCSGPLHSYFVRFSEIKTSNSDI